MKDVVRFRVSPEKDVAAGSLREEHAGSTVVLTPTSAHAAAELGNGTIYVSAVANGSFTVVHASNSQTDRSFVYATLG